MNSVFASFVSFVVTPSRRQSLEVSKGTADPAAARNSYLRFPPDASCFLAAVVELPIAELVSANTKPMSSFDDQQSPYRNVTRPI